MYIVFIYLIYINICNVHGAHVGTLPEIIIICSSRKSARDCYYKYNTLAIIPTQTS